MTRSLMALSYRTSVELPQGYPIRWAMTRSFRSPSEKWRGSVTSTMSERLRDGTAQQRKKPPASTTLNDRGQRSRPQLAETRRARCPSARSGPRITRSRGVALLRAGWKVGAP